MADIASLQLGIDARKAAEGAQQFEQAGNKIKSSAGGITSTMSRLSSIFRMGAFTYLLNSTMDTVTAMDKARRSGDSMFDAFIAGLPIINRLADSARKMADSLSGAAEAADLLAGTKRLSMGIKDLQTDMERSIQLNLASTNTEKERLQTLFEYQDRIEKIGEVEKKEIDRIEIYNRRIDEQIKGLEKLKESKLSTRGFGGFGSMGVAPPRVDFGKEIQELENTKLNLEKFGQGT